MEGEEVARAFARLKKEGKVRYFGVSTRTAPPWRTCSTSCLTP